MCIWDSKKETVTIGGMTLENPNKKASAANPWSREEEANALSELREQRRARVASHRAAQPSPRGGWQRRRAIVSVNDGARQGIVRAGAAGFRARCEQQKLRRPAPAPGEHAHWWANPPMPLVPHAHCWTKPERTRQGLTQWVLCAQGRKAWGHCLIASVFQRSASTFERTKVRACPVSCCVRARRRQRPALDNYGVTLKFPRVLSRTASP